MGNYDNLTTIADYAKKVGVTPGAVGAWLEEYNKTSDTPVNPAIIAGNTRLFEVSDLERVEAEKGKVGQAIRERGYVHPDKHAELESRYWGVVQQSAETQAKLNEALAKVEILEHTANSDTVSEIANFMAEVEVLKAELTAARTRIDEQAQTITNQNAVIVRASVENGDFVKEIDELNTVLAKAKEKNDALILENLSKQDRIKGLVNDVESLKAVTSGDDSEKLSDAYAEIQKLKEQLKAAEAFGDSVVSG